MMRKGNLGSPGLQLSPLHLVAWPAAVLWLARVGTVTTLGSAAVGIALRQAVMNFSCRHRVVPSRRRGSIRLTLSTGGDGRLPSRTPSVPTTVVFRPRLPGRCCLYRGC